MSNPISAKVRVRATFTTTKPVPFFIAGVEIIEGTIESEMYANIPLNRATSVAVKIIEIAPIKNDYGVELIGLVLDCDDDELLQDFLVLLDIGDEIWNISTARED